MTVGLFYEFLFVLPLSVTVVLFAELTETTALSVFVTLTAVVYELLIKHKRTRIKMILGGLLATIILGAVFYHPRGERLDFIVSCVWIAEIFLTVFMALLTEAISVRHKFIRVILSAAGIVTLCFMLYKGWVINRAAVIFAFFYVVITAADIIQHYSKKDGDSDEKKHLVYISPFIICVFIVASLFRSPEEPYDWAFLTRLMESIETRFSVFTDKISGNGWDSKTPIIGFTDRGNIGGNLGDTGYTVMEIKTNQRWGPCVYLTGRIFDTFDGRCWYDECGETESGEYFDTIETYGALLDVRVDGYMSDLALKIDISMQYLYMNTDRIFAASKCLPGFVTDGDTTKFSYFRLNLRSEKIKGILNNGHIMTPGTWDDAVYDLNIPDSEQYTYEEYLRYRQNIYDMYLSGTDISEKARQYVDAYIGDVNAVERIQHGLRIHSVRVILQTVEKRLIHDRAYIVSCPQ